MLRSIILATASFVLACAHGAHSTTESTKPAPGGAHERADREPGRTPGAAADVSPLGASKVGGELSFYAVEGGVRMEGQLGGLGPNAAHGFHIHEVGDCSAADGSSAGPHFNPTQAQHGAPGASSHVGDLGNVQADGAGNAVVSVLIDGAGLGGGHDLLGRAVVVHAKPDDLSSQPSGQSGARIGCGVIKAK